MAAHCNPLRIFLHQSVGYKPFRAGFLCWARTWAVVEVNGPGGICEHPIYWCRDRRPARMHGFRVRWAYCPPTGISLQHN